MSSELRPRAVDQPDGAGSAHAGVRDWGAERLSALAMTPLSLWFLAAFAVHGRAGYGACVEWLRQPLSATLIILLLIALFRHLELGLEVIIEDYMHASTRVHALILVRLLCFALAAAGIIATLRILLGH
ncbi:MAG: succinate dehydrogenase, hydrophobic membrane anchor protein [Steroidobacteraceae bacterium]